MAFAFDFAAMLAAAGTVSAASKILQATVAQPAAQGSGLLDRRSQRVGLAMTEKALALLAPRGSADCEPVIRTLDTSLAAPNASPTITPTAEALAEDARLILRARCGSCAERCATPLL